MHLVTPLELKTIRKLHMLTQAELAKLLDVTALTISNWERGRFAIPGDLAKRLAAANLRAPAQEKAAQTIVTALSAPQCYRPADSKHEGVWRTLAHPKWWCGVRSPFSKLCTPEQWEAIDQRATMAELAVYIPPTPQQAFDLMVARGIPANDAADYLAIMGSPLAGYVRKPRLTMADITGGEITDDSIGN